MKPSERIRQIRGDRYAAGHEMPLEDGILAWLDEQHDAAMVAPTRSSPNTERGMIGMTGGRDPVVGPAPSITQLRRDLEYVGDIEHRGNSNRDELPEQHARLRAALDELEAWRAL